MASLHIQRSHRLGLEAARALTEHWVRDGTERLGLTCELSRTEWEDVVVFRRTGLSGQLTVTPERFELRAQLGFLLSAYHGRITDEIHRQLDAALGPSTD